MIETLDFYVRLIAVGTALFLLAQLSAGEIRPRVKIPALAMIVGVVAYLIDSTPPLVPVGPADP